MVVLLGGVFVASLDLFVVNVAFDEIGRDFATKGGGPTQSQLGWILTAYAVIYAALLIPMGRLTDRYGRKLGFVAGLAVFTIASAACALSEGVWTLVAFRVLQAVGAAALTPTSLSLLLNALPAEKRAGGARLWAAVGALAAAFGPAVGGFLVAISWHWAFLINIPIGIALIVLVVRYVPDVRHNRDAPSPDLLGSAVLAVAIGAAALGLVQGNAWGWSSGRIVGTFVIAVLLLAYFAWRSAHHTSPVIDPGLFKLPMFPSANLATMIFSTAFGASLLGGILWMQELWGYSSIRTGLAVAIGPVFVPIVTILSHRYLPRAKPQALVAVGTAICALATAYLALTLTVEPNFAVSYLPAWIFAGIGVGFALPNLIVSATTGLPPELSSTGSGVVSMSRQIGFVWGVSIFVAIVGTGAPSADSFRPAWWFIAGTYAATALLAYAMQRRHARPLVEPVETRATIVA